MDWMNDVALRVEMGLPLPDSPPPARDILRSICKSSSKSEKGLDEPSLLGKGKNSSTSNQVNTKSYKEDHTYQDSTPTVVIKSTPQGRTVRWKETGLHHRSAKVLNLQLGELPFQEGTPIAPSEDGGAQDIEGLCREVLMVRISEI